MSACIHAMVEGVNAKLAQLGEVAWPNEKVASEVCYELSQHLNGPEVLPAGGLSKESALMIANLLKQANAEMIADGGVDEASARGYLAKTAADARDLRALASEVAGNCMLKAAEDTLLQEPGESGDNTLSAAAGHDPLARLDLKNRGEGAYNAGLGNTALPDVGQVGETMPHAGAPDMGDVPNSLDIKMANLRRAVDRIKTAGGAKGSALSKLKEVVERGKAQGSKAMRAAGGAAGKAKKSVGEAVKKHGPTAAAAGVAGGLGALGGFAASEATKEKKEAADKTAGGKAKGVKGVVGKVIDAAKKHKKPLLTAGGAAVGGAAAGVAASQLGGEKKEGAARKTASFEAVVMRGFRKVAAEDLLASTLTELKVASVDELDPDALRALADYIEQNISEQSNSVDLSQLDPQVLAALHAQGAMDGGEDEGGEFPPDNEDEEAEGPAAKAASVLARIKRAAEGGMANETAANTLDAAAGHDPVARLDKKNRPSGSYNAGLGATSFPNEGQVGHSQVVDEDPENPKNTVTTELKSAALSAEESAFVAQIEKMAMLYSDQLPSTLNRVEKIAALKELAGKAPSERRAFLASLR